MSEYHHGVRVVEVNDGTRTRAEGDQHRFLLADRDAYSGVKAYYYDVDGSERMEAMVGGEENAKTLRHTYANRHSALRAARSEWKKLQRGGATLRPELSPEWHYQMLGIKAEIGALEWLGERVTHQLGDGGLTTGVEMQTRRQETERDRYHQR